MLHDALYRVTPIKQIFEDVEDKCDRKEKYFYIAKRVNESVGCLCWSWFHIVSRTFWWVESFSFKVLRKLHDQSSKSPCANEFYEWCYIIFRRTTMQCLQNNYRDVALLADIDDIFCRVVWHDKDGVPVCRSLIVLRASLASFCSRWR